MSAARKPVSSPALVLVADDHADTLNLYGCALESAGLQVAFAATGREAVARAYELRPACIVMDALMPDIDGFAATQQLKTDPLMRHIPVVMVTGHVSRVREEPLADGGADRLLTKPCPPSALIHEILALLGR